MRYVLVVTLCVAGFAVPAMADLNLKNGSVIRFTDNTTMSTAAGVSAPADHGGFGTTVSGVSAFVGGGNGNTASGYASTVGGGYKNAAGGKYSTVAGGGSSFGPNTASGDYSAIGGGDKNTASGTNVTIGGGFNNRASYLYTTISGGYNNVASGYTSTVGGGHSNTASGNYSFVAGYNADDLGNTSSFVWGGYTGARTSAGADTFNVWSAGGIYFNGGPVHTVSDRNIKEGFSFVSAREVLDKVVEMPVTTWRFKSEDDSIRHIGPMAQDFMAAFGYGKSDKHIVGTDADGVALVAIQGLYAMQREKDEEITALRWHNAQLQAILRSRDELLEARFARLEKAILNEED